MVSAAEPAEKRRKSRHTVRNSGWTATSRCIDDPAGARCKTTDEPSPPGSREDRKSRARIPLWRNVSPRKRSEDIVNLRARAPNTTNRASTASIHRKAKAKAYPRASSPGAKEEFRVANRYPAK